jgi:lipopolysaccharide/colanic/teichoic acid biosynthesis glycosyltransferase
MKAKRLLDIIISSFALVASIPLFIVAALGIRLSSRGPILYRAPRVGLNGEVFVMHKFRTMDTREDKNASAISRADDPRVFAFGSWLRRMKIDELPQFYDVLRGKMSLVGPRPEDPRIVRDHYSVEGMETLAVLPGLTSTGSLYYYTNGEKLLTDQDPEVFYVKHLLPIKLALDSKYIHNASLTYDLKLLLRTAQVIVLKSVSRRSVHFKLVSSEVAKDDFK